MKNQAPADKSKNHLIGGIVVLTIGLVFLLRNFDLLTPELRFYIFSWKTLLIGIGILNLTLSKNKVAGFILIAIGTFFWLPNIFDLSIRAGQLFWPVVIIVVGIMLLFKRPGQKFNGPWNNNNNDGRDGSRKEKGSDTFTPPNQGPHGKKYKNTSFSDADFVDDVAIFSGTKKRINSSSFKGGRMTAIFGGSEVNLTRSRLAPGRNYLNVFFMFGGSEIIVPSDWNVVLEAVPIFGGFSDERYVSQQMESEEGSDSVLIIKGLVIFGGAEIKSY